MRGMCAACWFVRQTSVRVSALTDTSGATCHGAGSTSVGFWERELLFDLIHEQLSIMNASLLLILLAEPLLSKYFP